MRNLIWIGLVGLVACSGDKSGTTDHTAHTGHTDDTPACDLSCTDYCTTYLSACSADATNTWGTDQAACEADCANFACGTADDVTGNTLGCRIYHAGVAAQSETDATVHCPHAGENPTDQCVDM